MCLCVCVHQVVDFQTRSHQTGHQEIRPDAVFSSHILFFAQKKRSPRPDDAQRGPEMNTMCLIFLFSFFKQSVRAQEEIF